MPVSTDMAIEAESAPALVKPVAASTVIAQKQAVPARTCRSVPLA
jgi:hypothetical protein